MGRGVANAHLHRWRPPPPLQIGDGLPIAVSLVAVAMGLNLLEVLPLSLPSLDVDVRGLGLPPAGQAYLAGGTRQGMAGAACAGATVVQGCGPGKQHPMACLPQDVAGHVPGGAGGRAGGAAGAAMPLLKAACLAT